MSPTLLSNLHLQQPSLCLLTADTRRSSPFDPQSLHRPAVLAIRAVADGGVSAGRAARVARRHRLGHTRQRSNAPPCTRARRRLGPWSCSRRRRACCCTASAAACPCLPAPRRPAWRCRCRTTSSCTGTWSCCRPSSSTCSRTTCASPAASQARTRTTPWAPQARSERWVSFVPGCHPRSRHPGGLQTGRQRGALLWGRATPPTHPSLPLGCRRRRRRPPPPPTPACPSCRSPTRGSPTLTSGASRCSRRWRAGKQRLQARPGTVHRQPSRLNRRRQRGRHHQTAAAGGGCNIGT